MTQNDRAYIEETGLRSDRDVEEYYGADLAKYLSIRKIIFNRLVEKIGLEEKTRETV